MWAKALLNTLVTKAKSKTGQHNRSMWRLKQWSKAEDETLVITLGNLKAETLVDMLADTPGEERAKTLKDTMAM